MNQKTVFFEGTSSVLVGMLFILSLGLSGAVVAEELQTAEESSKPPWDKGSIKLGGYVTSFDSNVSFGINGLGGVQINGEDVLGLDSTLTVFKAQALYRPGKSLRHQVDLSYASYDRSGSTTLNDAIEIDGETLLPGTDIDSEFSFQLIRLNYSYAVLQDDRMRISAGLGVYGIPLKYGIDITNPGDERELEVRDATFPLPTLALQAEFLLTPRFYLVSEVNALYLEISDFQGSLIDFSLGLEYRPWTHFALGAALNSTSVHVEAMNDDAYPAIDYVGSVDMDFVGLMLYGKLTF